MSLTISMKVNESVRGRGMKSPKIASKLGSKRNELIQMDGHLVESINPSPFLTPK